MPGRPSAVRREGAGDAVAGQGPGEPTAADLRQRLGEVSLAEEQRIGRRLERLRGQRDAARRARELEQLSRRLDAAAARVTARREGVPAISYPDLPVSARRADLLAAISEHQVVVVAGETGSGKTTQLPKLCLELGRGVRGLIGHTQPRRIAARAVADRIAEELGPTGPEVVGYKVRFTDTTSDTGLVKVMTDGILLAELTGDRDLLAYDTLIIDEAHERSLNIDFILGYLAQLLPRRPDLKVIITSATIDPEKFSAHFGGAPIIEVSGRTYPVEVRYRPLVEQAEDDDEDGEVATDVVRDQAGAVCDAVRELCAEGPGDILVFLSGEREIRDTADALNRLQLRHTEILPLYARLSAAEQHRVFSAHTGRRVVLSTNVAETSLTVPGIRYVVDPGTARISRYSNRTKVQRLPIEPISQASARQRAGRCGRVEAGIAIRLYSEAELQARPQFTDPEIQRTNLASVILSMTALGLGDVGAFPFVDPPDSRSVKDGEDLLVELGAFTEAGAGGKRLTETGRRISRLPIDPRLARMVIEADRLGCVREVMVVAAGLSIQDPRERPAEHQQAADESHRRFAQEDGDLLAWLRLWEYLKEQQKELSGSAFRRMCKREYLSWLRIREWQDLVAQLRSLCKEVGISASTSPAPPERVHQAMLTGLLSHVGLRDAARRDYLGARGARFAIWPGSALARRSPDWVMAAELVETSRLWGRTVAQVDPSWVEAAAQHLVKRTYSEPHWSAKRAQVVASERVTLYGVPLVAGRTVGYGRIDPPLCRDLFIRHALVEGDWKTQHAFFTRNRELIEDVEELEHRTRRRDLVVDDETLFGFYDARIPEDVVSGRHFDTWWKKARRAEPELLTLTEEVLRSADTGAIAERFPDRWTSQGADYELSYRFEPGARTDGVSVHVPLEQLHRVRPEDFAWQVPGLREELVTALIRSLPKSVRTAFVPAPDHARRVLAALGADRSGVVGEELLSAVGRELGRIAGVPAVPAAAFDLAKVPGHLLPTFVVEDGGRQLATGKDLAELRQRLAGQVRATIARAAISLEREGLTGWTFGDLPEVFEQRSAGVELVGYPALVDTGDTVAVRVLASPALAAVATRAGTRRLIVLGSANPAKRVLGQLSGAQKLALASAPHAGAPALFEDCLGAAVDDLVERHGGPVRDQAAFEALAAAVRADLSARVLDVVRQVAEVLRQRTEVEARCSTLASSAVPAVREAVADVRAQVETLVHPGFVTASGVRRLPDLTRYLQAAAVRLDRVVAAPDRDAGLAHRLGVVQDAYDELLAELAPERQVAPDVVDIWWSLEELRVGLFAPGTRTAHPVSEQRISRAVAAARAGAGPHPG